MRTGSWMTTIAWVGIASATGCAAGNHARLTEATSIHLRKQLARSLAEHHEWAAASQPLFELKARYPNDPEVHTLLGTVYREQGLHDASEAEFQTAIRMDPRSAEAYDGLGILREVRGDDGDEAVANFKKSIALSPDRASTYNNLGFAFYVRGRYTDAVTAFREGLRRQPGARRMRNNLGFAYGRLGHLNRAKREFERGGSRAEAQNNLGYAYEQAQDPASACSLYREAALLEPNLTEASANAMRACAAAATESKPQGLSGIKPQALSELTPEGDELIFPSVAPGAAPPTPTRAVPPRRLP